MGTFVERPRVVEAVQVRAKEVSGAGRGTSALMLFAEHPGWLVTAINRGTVRLAVIDVGGSEPLWGCTVETIAGPRTVGAGGWILRDRRGELSIMGNDAFHQDYQPRYSNVTNWPRVAGVMETVDRQ